MAIWRKLTFLTSLALMGHYMHLVKTDELGEPGDQAFFKALPVLMLAISSFSSPSRSLYMAFGLAASALGDVFLVSNEDVHFLCGLIAFFVAHVLYCISFSTKDVNGTIMPSNWSLVVILQIIGLLLRLQFIGIVPEMAIPITAYTGVIMCMLWRSSCRGNLLSILGSLSFLISDFILAASKFGALKEISSSSRENVILTTLAIMGTYYLAQALLTADVVFRELPLFKAKAQKVAGKQN